MGSFSINDNRMALLAGALVKLHYLPDDLQDLTPFKDDEYRETHFIFFLTAIDHNTHGKERYEEVIDNSVFHGSELMYQKAIRAALADPDLLTPARLKDATERLLTEIFATPEGQVPVGIPERAALWRDAAAVLVEGYQGDLRNLFAMADGFLRRPDGKGILDLLKRCRAYEDPLEKKSFLLVKTLRRRGRLTIRDPGNLRAPVDHVLFTIALRSGIVVAEAPAKERILAGRLINKQMLNDLRLATLQAYQEIATVSGIPVDVFDDVLWGYGRECLKFARPCSEAIIEGISSRLDDRVASREARDGFLRIMNGLDAGAPEGTKLYPVPAFPATWYF